MRLYSVALATSIAATTGSMTAAAAAQPISPLTMSGTNGGAIHIMPTYETAKKLGLVRVDAAPPPVNGDFTYNFGHVMQPFVHYYVIYWQPSTLQDGSATSLSNGYKAVQNDMVRGYSGHPLASTTTQYYEIPRKFITGTGELTAWVNDTQPYPTSACNAVVGANCITDGQLQAEIQRVMAARGWTGGLDRMFLVYTSSGEGSCKNSSTTTACSTRTAGVPIVGNQDVFCGYHGTFFGTAQVIYSNLPFGDPVNCVGSGQGSPNTAAGGAEADPAADVASHEIAESLTDPGVGSGWIDPSGNEIADVCSYQFGGNTWKKTANQYWLGRYFELQMIYSNHHGRCEQVGP